MAKSSPIEQQKILRVFKLINLLQSTIGKPVHRLAELLQPMRGPFIGILSCWKL